MTCPQCGAEMDVYGVEMFDVRDTKLRHVVLTVPLLACCPRCGHTERDLELDMEPEP